MQTFLNGWAMRMSALVLAFAACVPAALASSDQESLAIGTWYGEVSTPGQPLQRFLTSRAPNGTFVLQTRLYDKGRAISELRNSGLWGISNGMYFTFTTEVNGKQTDSSRSEMTNPYLVRSLNATSFEYQHIPSKGIFRVIRVDPATARLPD
jgi:hypothetical protein